MQARGWRSDDPWRAACQAGLGDEIEDVIRAYYPKEYAPRSRVSLA